jgi:hypothetical protein
VRTDPDTRDARRVKWVRGLRKLGLTGSVSENDIAVDFSLGTQGLSEGDLPIAAGGDAPGVLPRERDSSEVSGGVRDPAQVIRFAEDAGRAVNPTGFGQFQAGLDQIRKARGVDLDKDFRDQFTGDLQVTVGLNGSYAARAEVDDAAALKSTLAKLRPIVPDFLAGAGLGRTKVTRDGDLYRASPAGGGRSLVYGVTRGVFVLATDAPKARSLGSRDPVAVPGADGALVAQASAEAIANRVVSRFRGMLPLQGLGSALLGAFTKPLGDVTLTVRAETGGLRGKIELPID